MARFRPIKLLFAHDNTGYAAKGPGNESATGRIAAYVFCRSGTIGTECKNGRENPAVGAND
jgi:hypothetical protein